MTLTPQTVLTWRQQEILLYCVGRGYYEIPRRSTLRELAKDVGISPTSLSLVLRRAERAVITRFAEQSLGRSSGAEAIEPFAVQSRRRR